MSGWISSLFGGGNSAQNQELALLQTQQNEQNAVAAGQEKLLQGGGSGLLAYTGDESATSTGMAAVKGLNTLLSGGK